MRIALILLCTIFGAATLLAAASGGTFSGDNGEIAYTCAGNVCSIEPDGTGQTVVHSPGADPSWSQDASKIAYVDAGIGIRVSGVGLLPNTAAATQPSFSADNTRVAFVRGGDIYTTLANTGGSEQQLTATGSNADPAYSPDGAKIAFASNRIGTWDIWVLTLSTLTLTQLTSGVGDERNPTWSPTGATIVYQSSSNGHLFAVSSSGGSPQDLNVSGTEPTYAPDGTKIAFVDGGQIKIMVAQQNGAVAAVANTAGATQPDWQRVTPSGSGGSGGGSSSGPTNTSYPTINYASGDSSPVVGHLLTATVGSWNGTFPITYTFQWKRCNPSDPVNGECVNIPNATSSSYTPTSSDYGMRLRVGVTARDSNGTSSQNSEVTAPTQAIAPRNTATPQITPGPGAVVDTSLTLTAGAWAGSTPVALKYEWRRCNPPGDLASCIPILGATATTYTPTIADIGFTLRVWITGSNVAGSDVAITNHTFPVVDKPHFAPSVQTMPAIAGTALPGRQLTANIGAFRGDAPIATTFHWYRCDAVGEACHAIAGATKVTYNPSVDDVGFTLRLFVFASNAYGTLLAKSDPTDAIAATPPNIPGRHIVGSARGEYLAGGGHDDTIFGMGGNDTILGGAGDDRLDGGRGNDVITGGIGADRIAGGLGSDSISVDDGERDIVDCGDGRDRVVADPYDLVRKSCEVVVRRAPGV
jgi:hypothetical protein